MVNMNKDFFLFSGAPQNLLKYSSKWKMRIKSKTRYSGSGIILQRRSFMPWVAAYQKSDPCEKVRISVLVRPGWRKLQSSTAEVQTNWASSSPKVKQTGLQPQDGLWEFRVIEDRLVAAVFWFFFFLHIELSHYPTFALKKKEKENADIGWV